MTKLIQQGNGALTSLVEAAHHSPFGQNLSIKQVDDSSVAEDARPYVVSQLTFAPAVHQHVRFHVDQLTKINDQSLEGQDTQLPVINRQQVVTVPLALVLRASGLLLIAFVVCCFLGNGTAQTVILNPLVGVVLGVSGGAFFAMSFASDLKAS